MFSSNRTVIQFSKDTIRASRVNLRDQSTITKLFESEYDYESLPQIFSEFKNNGIYSGRVLLSEDLSYVVSFKKESYEGDEREYVESKLSKLVPQDIAASAWDYKEVKIQDGYTYIQAYVIKKDFFDTLIRAVDESGLKIEAIEPVSLSISRILKRDEEVALVLHSDEFTTLGCIIEGDFVYISSHFTTPVMTKEIASLFNFVSTHFDKNPQRVILSGSIEGVDSSVFINKGYKVVEETINPIIGIAVKKDIGGTDPSTLNINEKDIEVLEEQNIHVSKGKNRYPRIYKNTKLLVFLTFIFMVILGAIGINLLSNKHETQTTPEVQVPVATNTPTPTPQEINIKDYSIQVQNGTGIAGSASSVEEILNTEGFIVLETTNADSFDYETTTINSKNDVPSEVIEIINGLLEKNGYTTTASSSLPDDSDYSIVVIVGLQEE